MNRFLFFLCSFFWGCGVFSPTVAGNAAHLQSLKAVAIPEVYTATVDSLALYISNQYATDENRLWAAYSWVASNIRYNHAYINVQTMMSPDKLAQWTLYNRVGVCTNFSVLFQALAQRLHIRSYTVTGYVNSFNSLYSPDHMWCVCFLNNKPYGFDPTYASANPLQFDSFYKVLPDSLIRTHMPVDALFQFLSYPLSFADFDAKTFVSKSAFFNWRDSLSVYDASDSLARYNSVLRRINAGGPHNSFVNSEVQLYTHNRDALVFNALSDSLSSLVQAVNALFRLANNHFVPAVPVAQMQARFDSLQSVSSHLSQAFARFEPVSADLRSNKTKAVEILPQLSSSIHAVQKFYYALRKSSKR